MNADAYFRKIMDVVYVQDVKKLRKWKKGLTNDSFFHKLNAV